MPCTTAIICPPMKMSDKLQFVVGPWVRPIVKPATNLSLSDTARRVFIFFFSPQRFEAFRRAGRRPRLFGELTAGWIDGCRFDVALQPVHLNWLAEAADVGRKRAAGVVSRLSLAHVSRHVRLAVIPGERIILGQ